MLLFSNACTQVTRIGETDSQRIHFEGVEKPDPCIDSSASYLLPTLCGKHWAVKWKSIQLLSHARPPLHFVSWSSNKFPSRLLSTWETNNAAQSPYKSESVPLENSIELLSRPIYKSGWPTSRRFEYVFYLDSSRLSRWICHIAILIIRGPTEPFTIWIKIILAIFLAKTRPDKTIFSALTNLTNTLIMTDQKYHQKYKCRIRSDYFVLFTPVNKNDITNVGLYLTKSKQLKGWREPRGWQFCLIRVLGGTPMVGILIDAHETFQYAGDAL